VEAANPAFSSARAGLLAPAAHSSSATSLDLVNGAAKGGGGGGPSPTIPPALRTGGAPPPASTPSTSSSRWWSGGCVAACAAIVASLVAAVIVGSAIDASGAPLVPACTAAVGLRPWGARDPATHWLNVTVDLDIASTGTAPFYAPYTVALEGGAYNRVLKTWNVNVTKAAAFGNVEGSVANWWMHLQPGARPLGMGMTVEAWTGDGAPSRVSVGGVNCTIVRRRGAAVTGAAAAAPPPPATPTPAPPPPPPPPLTSALTARDGKLFDADTPAGSPPREVFLSGINYMGYEYGLTLFDGIGTGERKDSASQDLATVAWRMRLLGLNAVRLPFDFKSVMTRASDAAQAPCWQVPAHEVLAATTDPAVKRGPDAPHLRHDPATVAAALGTAAAAAAAGKKSGSAPPPPSSTTTPPGGGGGASPPLTLPSLHSPPPRRAGWCNDWVPPFEALLDRFLWVIDFFTANGFYVVLDNQFNYDKSAMEDPGLWVAQWRKLAAELVARHPGAARRVLLDVLNEPDVWGLGWEAKPDPANPNTTLPSAGDLYLEAMDALHAVSPHWLYIIQGCGQAGLAKNWGDGLGTDPAVLSQYGATDPRPFFDALAARPYLDKVVLGPHVYPPSVYDTERNAPEGNAGPELFARLSQSFGYLNKKGYCPSGGAAPCHVFPIILGETGSGFTDDRDWQAQVDLADWAAARGPGADGLHNPIVGVFWWAWGLGHGPDGPDHAIINDMGVVGRDWTGVDWKKVRFLKRFGMKPWYHGSGGGGGGGHGGDPDDS
jgi:hypothetical protein